MLTLQDKVLPSSTQAIKFLCEHFFDDFVGDDVHVLIIALSFVDNR
jgi:hypothetical protein